MILWKHHVASDFNGVMKAIGVGAGGHMHEDLGSLIEYCNHDGREWYVAPVECAESDVEPDPNVGLGWYKARHTIPLIEPFMTLEKAEERYLNE